jgi:hypothetical protein
MGTVDGRRATREPLTGRPSPAPIHPGSVLQTERLDRSGHAPGQLEGVAAERGGQRDWKADRRQRPEDRLHQAPRERAVLLDQLSPRLSRSRVRGVQRRDRGLEIELTYRRRRDRHRVEPGAVIVDEPRQRRLSTGRGSTRSRAMFDHCHRQPGPGEMDRA